MSATTIKVDDSVRDRLAALARDRGITMGALLTEATERMEREAFFATARHQLDRLRTEEPEDWGAYRTEAHSWQEGTDRDALATRDEPGWWE